MDEKVRSVESFPNGMSNFGALGKRIEIGARAKITVVNEGFKAEYFGKTVHVNIGIGKDHTANLIMDLDAWEALNKGDKIHISTLTEFKEKFL